jgi:hypothetical protein
VPRATPTPKSSICVNSSLFDNKAYRYAPHKVFASRRIEKFNVSRKSKPSEIGIAIKEVNNKNKLIMLRELIFSFKTDPCPKSMIVIYQPT